MTTSNDDGKVNNHESSRRAYIRTVDRLEPSIHPIDASAFYASAAISLKRIADVLESAPKLGHALLQFAATKDAEAETLLYILRGHGLLPPQV